MSVYHNELKKKMEFCMLFLKNPFKKFICLLFEIKNRIMFYLDLDCILEILKEISFFFAISRHYRNYTHS